MGYPDKELTKDLYSPSSTLKNSLNNFCKKIRQGAQSVHECNLNVYNAVKDGVKSFCNSIEGIPYNPNLRTRVKKHLRKILAGGAIGIYEGVLTKYLHDLYNVFSDIIVRAEVWRGKLPIYPTYAELFPWPKLVKSAFNSQTLIFSRPMSQVDYVIKFFYDNPILQGVAIAAPFILLGIYYGIKKYGGRNEK